MKEKAKVLIACGGTGGHIFPAISLAQELKSRGYSEAVFITDKNIKTNKLIRDAGFYAVSLSVPKMPYGLSIDWLSFIIKFINSYFKAKEIIRNIEPDITVGFGAYTSGCVVYAAKASGIKTLIHEQNVLLGRANSLLLQGADRVCFSFENNLLGRDNKYILTGNPVREQILKDFKTLDKRDTLLNLKLFPEKKTLLVLGGSKGSSSINNLFVEMVKNLNESEKSIIQIIHITGEEGLAYVSKSYADSGITHWVSNFYDRIGLLYKASELIICRCGAATIAEAALFGIPAIFIPYPWAGRHQQENAATITRAEGAIMLEQESLKADRLKEEIFGLLSNKTKMDKMSSAMGSFAKPDAAKNLADAVEELLDVK